MINRLNIKIRSWLSNNQWSIIIRPFDGGTLIEIQDPNFRLANPVELYLDIIIKMFSEYKHLVLCQKIDEEQWVIGIREQFFTQLQRRYKLSTTLLEDFTSLHPPQETTSTYIFELYGDPRREWLQEVYHIGGFNLPNILYGFNAVPDNLLVEAANANSIFMEWYRLKEPDNELTKIFEYMNILAWTSDAHLWFCIPQSRSLENLIDFVTDLAHKYSLFPNIQWIS